MSRAALARQLVFGALACLTAIAAIEGLQAQARERVAFVSVIDAKTLAPVPDLTPDAFVVELHGSAVVLQFQIL